MHEGRKNACPECGLETEFLKKIVGRRGGEEPDHTEKWWGKGRSIDLEGGYLTGRVVGQGCKNVDFQVQCMGAAN